MNAKTRAALVCPIVGIMLLHRLEASWGANIQDGIGPQSENHGEKRNLSREDAYTAVQPGGRFEGDADGQRIQRNPLHDCEDNCLRVNARASNKTALYTIGFGSPAAYGNGRRTAIQEMRRGWKDAWPPLFVRMSLAIPA